MPERTITFAEWGEQWMDLIMTPQLIEDNLHALIKPDVSIKVPGVVSGVGKVTLGETTRTKSADLAREIVFVTPLQLALDLSLSVLGLYSEQYTVVALTELTLILRALPMLVLHLDCPPIKPEAVVVNSDGETLVYLLQQIADLDQQLQRFIASEINEQIAASAEQRTINVLERVRGAQELLKA